MRPFFALLLLAATASPALAQDRTPAARIEGHRVVHAGPPALTIGVPAKAVYVGALRFPLYGVADCELHVFVEATPDRRVRRLYWVQFESYLPKWPALSYDYGKVGDRQLRVGGHPTWVNIRFGRSTEKPRSGSDTEQVRGLLDRAGYVLPPDMMHVRLVRMLDDPQGTGKGRSELMLIYSEDSALIGKAAQRYRADSTRPLQGAAKIVARVTARFRVK